jgi:hypothetical protein
MDRVMQSVKQISGIGAPALAIADADIERLKRVAYA